MFPSSRPPNAQQQQHQHAQRTQFPSIIRTRSQQQRPLPPVDMYASPLKEAIRNHNHNHNITHQDKPERNIDSMALQQLEDTANDTDDEILLSPSHKKRASSPSFARNDNAGKRTRVLGESTKQNSVSRRHSEESLGTPRKAIASATPVKPSPAPPRAVSYGSPSKGIAHMDLTKLPTSPTKHIGSPTKTFKITTDGGHTVRVPITPARRPATGENAIPTPRGQGSAHPSPNAIHTQTQSPSRPPPRPVMFMQPSIPVTTTPTSTARQHNAAAIPPENHTIEPQDTLPKHMIPSTQLQFRSTPVRSGFLGGGLLFGGSPLTPLPTTPHPNGSTLPRRPSIPYIMSDHALGSAAAKSGAGPSTSSSSVAGASPTKSRIPVPSSSSLSRLPRPSSSLSISTLPVEGSSSPVKITSRPSPIRSKTRAKGKVRSGVRSRAPVTRLAAKRGVRRTSSSSTGPRPGTSSSVGFGAPLQIPLSEQAGPSNLVANVRPQPVAEKKKSIFRSSLLSHENTSLQQGVSARPLPGSASGSPKKPTPLTALSTALQKLLAAPPTAPVPRPRPNTSMGFSRPSLIPTQAPLPLPSTSQDDANIGTKTPGSARSPAGLQRSKTLGHSRLAEASPQKGLGRMGLPMRRPTTADNNGRSTPWTGAAFASKETTLSTVPASPARSAAPPSEASASSAPRVVPAEADVLDVDAWVPSDRTDKGKGKATDETYNREYLVPLADEPQLGTKAQPPPELVSPSRRASQASLSLTQSLSLPRAPAPTVRPPARSASTSIAVQPNPRTPVKTRGRTRPPPPPVAEGSKGAPVKADDPMGGKRSNARMPGSLDVLKDCVIYVDVRTEEGEDAAALFVDMLRGLGARILAKPGKSCTHLVYKAGLPSTITKYKLLPEPRPLPVSIGWVVECVETRAHVDETRFLVNLNEIGVAGGVQRRRSMQPKQMRTMTLGQLESGETADISVRADSSFTSEEPSTSGLILANLSPPTRSPNDHLPPLERARQRSLRLPRE